jgi:hypothetical protein
MMQGGEGIPFDDSPTVSVLSRRSFSSFNLVIRQAVSETHVRIYPAFFLPQYPWKVGFGS